MISTDQFSTLLKKNGLKLTDEELQAVTQLFISLAKIEYDKYREQKSDASFGQVSEPLDIGHYFHKNAS